MLKNLNFKKKILCILFLIFPNLIIFSKATASIQKILPDNYNIDLLTKPSLSTYGDYYLCPNGRASSLLYWRNRMYIRLHWNPSWNNPNKKINIDDLVTYDAKILAIRDLNIANFSGSKEVIIEELLKKNVYTQGEYDLRSSRFTDRDGAKMLLKNNNGDSIQIKFSGLLRESYLELKDKNDKYYKNNNMDDENTGLSYMDKISTDVKCLYFKNNKEYLHERTVVSIGLAGKDSYGNWLDIPDQKIFLILDSIVPTFNLDKGFKPGF